MTCVTCGWESGSGGELIAVEGLGFLYRTAAESRG